MSSIHRPVDADAVVQAWSSVFTSTDAFAWPFRPGYLGRIFFRTYGYHLTAEQYAALCAAIRATGEDGFFMSIVEVASMRDRLDPSEHWWCELPDYRAYSAVGLVLENALYSPKGTWGLVVSHELHALVGATPEFVQLLDRSYGTFADDLHALREEWHGNEHAAWLESVLLKCQEQESNRHRGDPGSSSSAINHDSR